ncbi:MAG: hypothetical protein KC766_26395 [Myxococcales bacterium]|nr:hypothetical protein [Myxococcales bacterium]MCB9535896.1 hypothetical protein [Myxococcales bacterium]
MTPNELREGDRVAFTIGRSTFHARVIEDRGHIGVGGRQIVRIELLPDDDAGDEPRRFEMPPEDLTREQTAA